MEDATNSLEHGSDAGMNTQPPQSSAPLTPRNRRIFLLGFGGFLAVVLLALAGVGVYRAYAQAAGDSLTRGVARVLRLPAASVNGQRILFTDYLDDVKAIHALQKYSQSSGGGELAALTEEQLSDQVILRLINNILLEEAAKRYSIAIDAADIDKVKSQIMQQFSTPAEVDSELQKRYGWTLAAYEDKVIRPFIIQSKLTERIQGDAASRTKVREEAEVVLAKIKAGADFAELARQYGQDGTKDQGGDLGWFGKGAMVPEFEAAVWALKKGELDKDLVESPFGYHIVRLDDRRTAKSKDSAGKSARQEEVKARHILFRFPSLDQYLDEQLKAARIRLFIKARNPLDEFKKA